ncbi:MAG: ATP-dependent sacrificial sulfur transferase LarE [candidate division Zixibacteria bacterium]|nr:ATP-dependent sacrificial sulfur transferase LarE [candidate division Zixibacteria bacterium]
MKSQVTSPVTPKPLTTESESEDKAESYARTKRDDLLSIISDKKSAVVAFSGGLDSSLVLWATREALGAENTLAVTSVSPSFPVDEKTAVEEFIKEIGLPRNAHRFISTKEMEIAGYYENSSRRCYFCKSELYQEIEKVRAEVNFGTVFDGLNLSDMGDFRPGRQAAEEMNVFSPLLKAQIDKPTAREICRLVRLSISEKPASPCLSSRIPHGVKITREALTMIDRAETALRKLGFSGFRVRYHNELARLELTPKDQSKLADPIVNDDVINCVKKAGFRYVALDLEGYRMGSSNMLDS